MPYFFALFLLSLPLCCFASTVQPPQPPPSQQVPADKPAPADEEGDEESDQDIIIQQDEEAENPCEEGGVNN